VCWWYLIWAAVEEYPHLAKCDDEIAADERLQTFEFLMTCVSVYTPHSRDFHYRFPTIYIDDGHYAVVVHRDQKRSS